MNIIKKVDIGNVRKINQDYVGYKEISNHEAFLVVCDGMGGHQAGEVASSLVVHYILDYCHLHDEFTCDEDIQAFLYQIINEANKVVYRQSLTDDSLNGMGTTIVMAYIKDEKAYIAHIGDSRAYLLGDDIEQVTVDDTWVNSLVMSGTITKEEAKNHPKKNVLLQAVGVSSLLKVSFYVRDIHKKAILLCSDGLYNSLTDDFILHLYQSSSSLKELGEKLIEEAKRFGGYDNIGLVLACKEVE